MLHSKVYTIVASLLAAPAALASPTLTTLLSFPGTSGQAPITPPVFDGSHTLFGTLTTGGVNGSGSIYALDTAKRTAQIMYSFSGKDGAEPYGLLMSRSGVIYGITAYGGTANLGTVFAYYPGRNKVLQLHAFNLSDGKMPLGTLIEDADGTLYGTTGFGGKYGYGTVFKLVPGTGAFTTLANLDGYTEGADPNGALVFGRDGALYGTTYDGGAGGEGTVFRVPANGGKLTVVFGFTKTTGGLVAAGLTADKAGLLYGTTSYYGPNNAGSVFKLDPASGAFTLLYAFPALAGNSLSPVDFDRRGRLVGATYFGGGGGGGDGTVFRINPVTGAYTLLHAFDGADGAGPQGGLTLAPDGSFYGATGSGGAGQGASGTVFKLRE